MSFEHEDMLRNEIISQLKVAGELAWSRNPLPWGIPPFKSAWKAAWNILRLFPLAKRILVMRDACLRLMREAVLDADLTLLIPTLYGDQVLHVPRSALFGPDLVRRRALRIDPLPDGCKPFNGGVDLVVVPCLGFSPLSRYPYSLEMERVADTLDKLYDGRSITPAVSTEVPVVVMAADQQEVAGWPESALALYTADVVITPTRGIVLGSGEKRMLVRDNNASTNKEML